MQRREDPDRTLPFAARARVRRVAAAGSTERKLLAGFAVAVTVVLAVVALAISSSNRNTRARAEVLHSSDILASLEETLSTMQDVETGGRGYVITGREDFLDPYRIGVAHVDDRLRDLGDLTASDPEQRAELDVLAGQIAARTRIASETVETRRNLGFEAAQADVMTGRGKAAMDAVRATIARMRDTERARLDASKASLDSADRAFGSWFLALAATLVAGVVLAFAAVRHDLRARAAAEVRLGVANGELVKTLDALFKKDQELRTLLAEAPDCVSCVDRDLRHVFVNEAVARATGVPASQLIGKTMREIANGEETDFERAYLAVFETGLPQQIDTHVSTLAGPRVHHVRFVPLRDVGSSVERVLAIGRDVTDARDAVERLRAAEERFDLAVRGAHDGIWDYSLGRDEMYHSPRCAEMLGYDPAEYPTRASAWAPLVHPDDLERVQAAFDAHVAGATENFDAEYRMRNASGAYQWVHDRGGAFRDEAGRPMRFVGSRADVDTRKRMDTELESARASLSARVSELESAIAEVRELRGILPICSYCKHVRDDRNYWMDVEVYFARHAETKFSHGICPDCYTSQVAPQLEELKRSREMQRPSEEELRGV